MNNITKETRRLAASAAVVACAATFGLPTFALALDGADILLPKASEFVPSLIAFIIIWVVLAKLAWPSILGMMDKRQQKIQGDLDAAEKAKVQAADEVKKYESKIAEANKEADAIVAKAKREAEEERSQILAQAQRESADIITKAHGAVDSERKKAMIELSGQVVDLSVEIASKIIGNDLSEAEQRKLAEKYLAEVSAPDAD